jgi:hypothetical protein
MSKRIKESKRERKRERRGKKGRQSVMITSYCFVLFYNNHTLSLQLNESFAANFSLNFNAGACIFHLLLFYYFKLVVFILSILLYFILFYWFLFCILSILFLVLDFILFIHTICSLTKLSRRTSRNFNAGACTGCVHGLRARAATSTPSRTASDA